MATKKRILVIGAGASGLTSIKACKEAGLDVVCCERSGDFGGLWRYRESNVDGFSSVMKATIANTNKETSCFSDFPPPKEFPIFLRHELVLKYLEMYAERFDLLSSVQYYEEVLEMLPSEDYGTHGRWSVKIRNLRRDEIREEVFDGVMACSGHHAYPNTPNYTGLDLFGGEILHSHDYKTYTGFEGKRVLVVGAANSGSDIAVELSRVAKVILSTRRGTWVYSRYFKNGKPFDCMLLRRSNALKPKSIVERNLEKMLNSAMDHERLGIRPYHHVLSQHPTISEELLPRIASGAITLKRDIKEFTEDGVKFGEETESFPLDAVVFATGYNIKFPFLSDDILRIGKNNKVFLYKGVFPPQLKHPTLAVIGLLQPNGPLFPVFEMQARWFASLVTGKTTLPHSDTMLSDVKKVEDFRARNYVQSQRHSIETDWLTYIDGIAEKLGVKPNMVQLMLKDPKLFWACLKGPCLPYHFRLTGPYKWDGARDATLSYKERLYASFSPSSH